MEEGAKIKFADEKQMYTVQATNAYFSICTKPLNMIRRLGKGKYKFERTVLYTIIDWNLKIRGTENVIFSLGATTKKECREMLQRLTSGESEISRRNNVKLEIEKIKQD